MMLLADYFFAITLITLTGYASAMLHDATLLKAAVDAAMPLISLARRHT